LAAEAKGRTRSPRYPVPVLEKLKAIAAKVPREEWDRLPADLSSNLDHYLHGAPQR
jgi:hypothetical protein